MKYGSSRFVILIGKYAFKFPIFWYGTYTFLRGCLSNSSERRYMKVFYHSGLDYKVAVSYYCSILGLVQIQQRAEPLNRKLTKEEEFIFEHLITDLDPSNFGLINNEIVCIDYA